MSAYQLQIHVNAVAPYELKLEVDSDGEFDLSLVDDAAPCVFEVLREDKFELDADSLVEWAAVVSDQSLTQEGSRLTLTHVYAAGDVPEIGTLSLRARIVHPSHANPIYTAPFKLIVAGGFTR